MEEFTDAQLAEYNSRVYAEQIQILEELAEREHALRHPEEYENPTH